MNLSTNEAVLVLLGCVVAIGAIWVLYRRGLFGGAKVEDKTPAGSSRQ
jgi:hypothetical protein